MSHLPEDRTIHNTAEEHVADHNELHRQHNLRDDTMLTNWCRFHLTAPTPVTPGPGAGYTFQEADFTIHSQSGDDFSLDTDGGHGYIGLRSASGGIFQSTVYFGPGSLTADESSEALRWLQLAYLLGPTDSHDPNFPVQSLGFDGVVPQLLSDADHIGNLAITSASGPGYVPAGDFALFNITATLIGGIGDDSLILDNVGPGLIWQVG